ncbi:MAG: VWA domain-containing protein [bacterium]
MLRFADSEFFALFLLAPIFIGFYYFVFKWKTRALARFGDLDLIKKLSQNTSRGRQKFKAFLIVLGVAFITLALARPQIGTRLEEVHRAGVDVIVALDVSYSMLAEDIKPNRLAKAKHEISQFIDLMEGDRIGLIAFAGDAFLQCPLTLDYGAAKTFLEIMVPELIEDPGTDLSSAIELAVKSFERQERKYKVLVLITDGEQDQTDKDPLDATRQAIKEGIVIYTVGMGSPAGVPIPLHDETGKPVGFYKNDQGEVDLTKIDHYTLEKIALTADGKYYQSTTGETKLEKVYEEITKMEKKELASMKFSQYEERFQFVLLIAIVLFMVELIIPECVKLRQEWRGRFE